MITLYTWPRPNGYKATILMEEMGLPYQVKLVNLDAGEQFTPEFLNISPNNKVPVIIDDDTPGGPVSIFESGLIAMHLADKTGKFLAPSGPDRLNVLQWVFWQVSALGPWPGLYNYFRLKAPERFPAVIERFQSEAARLLRLMEGQLSKHEYIAGPDYTIADIMCFVAAKRGLMTFRETGDALVEAPALDRWLEAVGSRAAVQRGLTIPKPIDWRTGNALPDNHAA
jgi:GST-like protein